MFKNVAGQSITVYAYTASTGLPKTGDAANITCTQRIDGVPAAGSAGTALSDTNPTPNTGNDGYYTFTLTAAETNGDVIAFFPQSATSGVVVIALPPVEETEPYAQAGTLPAYSGSGMTVSTAREWVRDAVRDMADSTRFGDDTIDRAIQMAGNIYCRDTRSIKRTDSVAITEGSTSFPLTAPIAAGFRPERLIDVWITDEETAYHAEIAVVEHQDLTRLAKQDDGSSVPTHLAFLDESGNGVLWRTPDDDYTAKLRYWLPFTTWTAGSDDATTLNIPTDLIMPVLKYGAAAFALEANKETRPLAEMLLGQFKAHVAEAMGAGSLGPRVIYRESMHTRRPSMRLGESEA